MKLRRSLYAQPEIRPRRAMHQSALALIDVGAANWASTAHSAVYGPVSRARPDVVPWAREGSWARAGPQGEQPWAPLYGDHQVGRFSAGGRQRYRLTADDKGAPAEPSRRQRQPLEALRLPQLQPQPAALSVRPPGQAVVVEHSLARRADRDQSEAPVLAGHERLSRLGPVVGVAVAQLEPARSRQDPRRHGPAIGAGHRHHRPLGQQSRGG